MSTNETIEKVAKNFVSNTLNVVNKKINDNNIITPSQAETNTLENKKFNLNVRIDGEKIYLSLNKVPGDKTNVEIGFFIDGFEENKQLIAQFLKNYFIINELKQSEQLNEAKTVLKNILIDITASLNSRSDPISFKEIKLQI